ncbi:proteinase [Streptomyces spiroverticillatus]|uniref:Proteinase n=1 Tax=Streptomyces finlayi TaxID=67296 RepID=A0A919C9H6_9ACTN|nr:alpha/beta hydrolase [Streptomyces finlayi]GHA02968.1 proteinase [Streptomyces spiroverticillatus]GHC87185.1 proteinase [Streptomyces finlayi]
MRLAPALTLSTLLLTTACGTSTSTAPEARPADLTAFHTQKPDWTPCPGNGPATPPPGFLCTTIKVPLDYSAPDGDTLGLFVTRRPATDRAHRLGALFVNPGGPGSPASPYAYGAPETFSPEVAARYDLVGVDPRGVGDSKPLPPCLDAKAMNAYTAIDTTPDDAVEADRLRASARAFAEGCGKSAGKLLPYVGTLDVARDMDVVRRVLGEEKLHYFGLSYGTLIGQVYAERFPASVGRMVLDSNVDPALPLGSLLAQQSASIEQTFTAYLNSCSTRPTCHLPKKSADAWKKIDGLLADLDATPIRSLPGRTLTDSDARLAAMAVTYAPSVWPMFDGALERAFQGDGSQLQILADAANGRTADGKDPEAGSAHLAVNCADHGEFRTPEQFAAAAQEARTTAPHFGPANVNSSLPCAYWPAESSAKAHPVTAPGTPPLLVIGNTDDQATPIRWSRDVAARLANARLVTNEASGHGAYHRKAGPCLTGAVDTYLLTGTAPGARTTTCPAPSVKARP